MNKYINLYSGCIVVDARKTVLEGKIVDERSHLEIFDKMVSTDDVDVNFIRASTAVRAERDALLLRFSWRYERLASEMRQGIETTNSIEALDKYAQELRDITKQVGFPTAIEWPVFE